MLSSHPQSERSKEVKNDFNFTMQAQIGCDNSKDPQTEEGPLHFSSKLPPREKSHSKFFKSATQQKGSRDYQSIGTTQKPLEKWVFYFNLYP